MAARALHYVFRIGSRQKSYDFYIKTLQMKVLRHEEFQDGCKATCNGPYDNSWSKTMVGYGHEDQHFVLELTYNYGVGKYRLGNDYEAIHIENDSVYQSLKDKAETGPENSLLVKDPDGHKFYVYPGKCENPVRKVSVNVKDLGKTREFWKDQIGMDEVSHTDDAYVLSFGKDQAAWEIRQLPQGTELDRAEAYGRIAFSYPTGKLQELQDKMKKIDPHYIQNELQKLDTPGKASVQVVILRDPNEHEICFVGEKEYLELSQFDHTADKSLQDSIAKDDSQK
ncbi:unnamed protein product [Bursaphelenchus okinawaensis]|uniref:VOC domain-containing protein n=1 Tax=Bursaphelenchus okinawaensis TaxID=465554 RepID=A0A811KQS6_9BILA|nr:unnamed protein product [Bursaphelenchus okinawaensis]CAG9108191.1 unnamed protein product [Bursaphelenchus okinawaensis]